jgi:putative membrane protein
MSWGVNVISVAVPLVVAVLLMMPSKFDLGAWTGGLPHMIGAVNTVASVTLVLGFIFIKRGLTDAHRTMMLTSLSLGVVFLVCYVTYHLTNEPRRFGGTGGPRVFYLLILFSHIGLSLVVLPLVLRAAAYAYLKDFIRHRRIARFAYPIWLYVSVTGVLVYLLGHQFNPAK